MWLRIANFVVLSYVILANVPDWQRAVILFWISVRIYTTPVNGLVRM